MGPGTGTDKIPKGFQTVFTNFNLEKNTIVFIAHIFF